MQNGRTGAMDLVAVVGADETCGKASSIVRIPRHYTPSALTDSTLDCQNAKAKATLERSANSISAMLATIQTEAASTQLILSNDMLHFPRP